MPSKKALMKTRTLIREAVRTIGTSDLDGAALILIRKGSLMAESQNFQTFAKKLGEMGLELGVVIVDEFHDLSFLDEGQMASHGWIRVEKELVE